MQSNGYGALLEKLKQVVAENQSLATRLEECKQIISAKDREIAALNQLVTEAGAAQSTMDNKMDEMQYMQDCLAEMKQLVEVASLKNIGPGDNTPLQNSDAEQALAELEELNTYQQVQLKDLKEQLKEIKARNSLLEQNVARIAELESLLAIAREERDEWKSFVTSKG